MLVTLALRSARSDVHAGVDPAAATTAGYVLALRVGAGVVAAAAVLDGVLLRRGVGTVTPTRPTG